MKRLVLPLTVVLALGCSQDKRRSDKLQSFRVTLTSEGGTPENPLPFVIREAREFTIDIEALDSQGRLLGSHNGLVLISSVPGTVSSRDPAEPTVQGGELRGVRVSVRGAFGPTHLWVEDRSGANAFAVGASPRIWFQNPRIRDVQEPTGSRDSSPLVDSVVNIDRGNNVVVHVSNNGFYVVDKDETQFASVFAFNFNRPEGLRRGDKLRSFGGDVQEFLGFTEIGFPSWDVDHRCPSATSPNQQCEEGEFCIGGVCLGQQCGERVCADGSVCQDGNCVPNTLIPDPVTNPPILITREMEKYEAGLVRFTDVMTTQDFRACDDPNVVAGANGNGVCEFCRTCNSNRDLNGVCPSGGRCCPIPQVCETSKGECTSICDANRDAEGRCEAGRKCCPPGNTCAVDLGRCDGCTVAEKAEAACDDECAQRNPQSPGGLCTNLCDFREFGQYRVGLTTAGQWNGASFLVVTSDTVPTFRPDSPENRGKILPSVTGVLRNIFAPGPLWIVEPRDECDVQGIERERTDCDTVR
jgi:hypothetical protein